MQPMADSGSRLRPDIFRYTEYRAFLKDFYLYQKEGNPAISHRYLAAKVGFDAGQFAKILSGKRNLTPSMVLKFTDIFKLNRKEKEYFEILVLANHAKIPQQRRELLARLQPLRPKLSKTIASGLEEYYRHWYHSALRELIGFYPFRGDWEALGKMLTPALTAEQARQGLELLSLLGFIKKDAQGRYGVAEAHITSGYKSPSAAVQQFIRTTLDLGKEALDRFPKESRNFSSMTFSTSENHFLQLQEKIRLFRKELADELDKVERPERVFTLNIQLFPLSESWSPEK
jgi:uncharacterized protein (TIGR02147 family)